MAEPKWLELARADMDVKELPGKAGHPRIREMYDTVGLDNDGDDKQSWCGCAMGTWLKEAGYPIPPNCYGAKQFETYGKASSFKPGVICVFYRSKLRERDWKRHVTIGIEETETHIKCIGGNQRVRDGDGLDGVTISSFPKSDLSAMRWPVAATATELRNAGSSDMAVASKLKKGVIAVATTAATGAVTNQATAPPALPAIPDLTPETMTWFQMMMEGANAVAKLVGAHPWLAASVVACGGGYVLAKHIEAKRIERAQRGDALSAAG